MSFITNLLKKLSPFYSVTDLYLFQKFSKKMNVSPYVVPYNIQFDGTTYWFSTFNCITNPNFYFKTSKDYKYFKEVVESNKNLLFKNMDITKDHSKEDIKKVFTDAVFEMIKVRLVLDSKKDYSIEQAPHLQYSIKNLVIHDYSDLFLKVGQEFVQENIIPILEVGRTCGLNISVMGDKKNIPSSFFAKISNTFESSGQSYYLNSEPFENVQKKYNDITSQLSNKSFISNQNIKLYDDKQFKNKALIGEDVFLFYDHPNYVKPQTHEEFMNEFNLEMRHGTCGKFEYIYGLKKFEDKLIVMGVDSLKIGYIEDDKHVKLSRARVSARDPRPKIDYAKSY